MNKFQKVYKVVSLIPKGKVSTYKIIAELSKTNPRIVGFALHANKNPKQIPCHRIIKSNGTLAKGYAFGGVRQQRHKLEEEGIIFPNSKVDMQKFLFTLNNLRKSCHLERSERSS
ncbi:MAG: MGMT family protein [bacterium]|nr:MGMT family protein [bacterium]